ncbi:MAG: hypothetical protein HC888_05250 [Candidatus Competibacteraceae bacterium]|nr:hypothetical protein [Candidatus Competibacteraceae bacterium]
MQPRYLGDAVYAHFSHGQIGLSLGSHTRPIVVWLEPEVLDALNQFAREALSLAGQDRKP